MNIILYSDSDQFAGTERHILDLAAGLRQEGAGVTIACPRPGALAERADAAHVPLLIIPKCGQIDRNAISILTTQLREGRADIVHAHNGRTHIAAAAAVRAAGRGACVTTQHFLSPARTTRRGPKAWAASFLHWRASASTAHTIAISDAVRLAAIARRDVRPEKITTVRNGSAPPDVSTAPDAATVRKALGLDAHCPLIFCAARLQAEKDIPTLIAAMPNVLAQHPAARCLIAGEGDQHAQLLHQIATLNVGHATTLLGFRNDIAALVQACDLFVLPALAEPFGLVLLEAMALGKPVIATQTGGPPEIVEHDHTGLLIPPQNPTALASAINDLLAHADKRHAFGAAGRQRYLDQFTIGRMAREMLDVYRKAAGSAAKSLKGDA